MLPVTVIILHASAGPSAGPLGRLLAESRAALAEAHRAAFEALGVEEVRVIASSPDELSFGRRLGDLMALRRPGGLVVLGSGALPLAATRDLGALVEIAGADERVALANNRYSADVVAIALVGDLPAIPELPRDNALPRWLSEVAGWDVRDLRDRWRLQVDLDGPLDLLLTGRADGPDFEAASDRLEAVRRALADPRAEVVVSGRTSVASLRWLERRTAARIRALVEERGFRASSPLAQASASDGDEARGPHARPPRSVIGLLLDRDGPEALGLLLPELGDAAVIDTRVLLAHRLGADEHAWPSAEDRFSSDLLDHGAIADSWLRAVTRSALEASIPVLLGGHSLVGPGIHLLASPRRSAARRRARRTGRHPPMEITPGLRRNAPLEPLPQSDEVLVDRIRDEIVAGGPMTFARFMELALYDPERGYYRTAETRLGRAGDFLTAPETHPVFGHAIARVLGEMWQALGRPGPFTLREYGAGSGTLAMAILRGLQSDGSPLLDLMRYEPVEIAEHRVAELTARLEAAGLAERLAPGGGQVVGCVLANEFLDALPVHRFEQRDGQFRELYVGWDTGEGRRQGRFVDVPGPPSTPALAARLAADGIVLSDGQRGEICLALDAWVADVAAGLERGFVLVIDYGHPAKALYGPERRDGTLRAYVRHRVGADPYAHVGRQDLTAHVDITALVRAAQREDLATLGVTTQAEFLIGAGAADLLAAIQADPATTLARYLELRASLVRMLDPAAMGTFRVVIVGRGVPEGTALSSLGYSLRG